MCYINKCFLFVLYSRKPEMPKERDVGEAAETTRRSSCDHQTHGTISMGTSHNGNNRPTASTTDATESVAFDQ